MTAAPTPLLSATVLRTDSASKLQPEVYNFAKKGLVASSSTMHVMPSAPRGTTYSVALVLRAVHIFMGADTVRRLVCASVRVPCSRVRCGGSGMCTP